MKYEITNKSKSGPNWATLYQIRALRTFGRVKEGELGGFIQDESNLSQHGNCWIAPDAMAIDKSTVVADAFIDEKAIIRDNAHASGSSWMLGFTQAKDDSVITDNATARGKSSLRESSRLGGDAGIFDNVILRGNSCVESTVELRISTQVLGDAWLNHPMVIEGGLITRTPIQLRSGNEIILLTDTDLRVMHTQAPIDKWYSGDLPTTNEDVIRLFLNYKETIKAIHKSEFDKPLL